MLVVRHVPRLQDRNHAQRDTSDDKGRSETGVAKAWRLFHGSTTLSKERNGPEAESVPGWARYSVSGRMKGKKRTSLIAF